MSGPHSKIGLLDHMGWGNMGDAAVQEAFIANIRKRLPDAELVAFSLNPEDTTRRHGLPSHPIIWDYPRAASENTESGTPSDQGSLKKLLKRWHFVYAIGKPMHDCIQEAIHLVRSFRAVRSLDLLILSGGGQFSEMWRGPWSHPYNVFKFSVMAKLSGTPLVIMGVGAGPLESSLSQFFVRWSVRLARYTSVRDDESAALLRRVGVAARILVCPDPVYALPVSDYVSLASSRRPRPKVGINPIGFCDPRLWAVHDLDAYRRYLGELEHFSTWLLDRGYDIEIFTAEISVDRYAVEELKERLTKHAAASPGATVACVPRFHLDELLVQMSGCDFVITSKFHGVVFSHLLSKPVIALTYHRKIDDLMRTVGHGQYCMPIGEATAERLAATFEALVASKEEVCTLFKQATRAYSGAVKAEFDRVFGMRNGESDKQVTEETAELCVNQGQQP